jgi:acetyltransferase-like isoleucine patch superfamily enzyme
MKLFKILRKIFEISINLIVLKSEGVKISLNCIIKIKGLPMITNKGKLIISDGVNINSRFSANPIGGQGRTSMIVEKGAVLFIGSNCGISNSSFYCKKKIEIGKDVLIGGSCKFYDTDFHSLNLNKRISSVDDDIKSKEIKICDGVFIGAHSIILKGVVIGENSIIGAGSVVTKNVPPHQIWAGNPIKFIRNVNVY